MKFTKLVILLVLFLGALPVAAQPSVERVVMYPWNEGVAKFFKDFITENFPDSRFFFDSSTEQWICEGPASDLDRMSSMGMGPGSLGQQRGVNEVLDELEAAPSVRYFTLPGRTTNTDDRKWLAEYCQGYEVLSVRILEGEQKRRLLETLRNEIFRGGQAMCFQPHEALSVKRDGKEVSLVICYMCSGVRAFRDGHVYAAPIGRP